MNEKKETTLNEAIVKIKVELQEKKLKQSGKNTFAGFTYFELSDFLPTLNKLMQENGVNDQIIINREYAEMTLHKGSESQTYTIPFVLFDTPKSKNGTDSMQHIQYLGALNTYYKRYLYLNAFGITDGEVIDAMNINELQQKPPIKNYSIQEVTQLAGVKNIPIEKICDGYKIESLDVASQELLNKIYGALLKK